MMTKRFEKDNQIDFNSEAEKHLNYNMMPSQEVQRKIDYYVTPYNSSKTVHKYMMFNTEDKQSIKALKK